MSYKTISKVEKNSCLRCDGFGIVPVSETHIGYCPECRGSGDDGTICRNCDGRGEKKLDQMGRIGKAHTVRCGTCKGSGKGPKASK